MKKILWVFSMLGFMFTHTTVPAQNQVDHPLANKDKLSVRLPLTASFTKNIGSPTRTERYVTYDAVNSTGAKSYHWDFGDNTTGEGVIIAHSYKKNGLYNISLIVADQDGNMSSSKEIIQISGIGREESLFAGFNKNIGSPTPINQYVTFDAIISTGAKNYHWDFGDGTEGEGPIIAHPYTKNGSYEVALTINGPQGSQTIVEAVVISGIEQKNPKDHRQRGLKVYPNPTTGLVTLQFETNEEGMTNIYLSDVSGRKILNTSKKLDKGGHFEAFNFNEINAGVYFLTVESASFKDVQMIIRE